MNKLVKEVRSPKNCSEAREDILFLCFVFLIIAASVLVGCVIEHGSFAILAESMTCRLRVAILKAIFRQEIGFHDDPENTPGPEGLQSVKDLSTR